MSASQAVSLQGAALLRWVATLGAVTAEALALLDGSTPASARARLAAAERRGHVRRFAPLRSEPALYAITSAGVRAGGEEGLAPARVSAGGAAHAATCARAAAALARAYPNMRVLGEPVLRREAARGGGWSCEPDLGSGGVSHRPDAVLIEPGPGAHATAVEVELTSKAPARLESIVRAWARCRAVDGVLYIAGPAAERAVQRAIERAGAEPRVIVLPLADVAGPGKSGQG